MDILPTTAFVEGAESGLQAWTRASDAYLNGHFDGSVPVWVLLIAGGIVLLEWLLARRRR
jgi:hypothetical protein